VYRNPEADKNTNLLTRNNLSVSLLNTTQHTSKVPETRFSNNMITGKNLHFVKFWIWLILCRKFTANNDVLPQLKIKNNTSSTKKLTVSPDALIGIYKSLASTAQEK